MQKARAFVLATIKLCECGQSGATFGAVFPLFLFQKVCPEAVFLVVCDPSLNEL
jgi:hypothetical protein